MRWARTLINPILGFFREFIDFATTQGTARLGVQGEQEKDLYINPAFLRCGGKQFPVKRTLVLRHAPDYFPQITEVSSEAFEVSLESVSSIASDATRILLSLNPKISPPAQSSVRMTLKDRKEPLLLKMYIAE